MADSYPVALYDMSIKNVKERAEKRLVFEKGVQAANFLGYIPGKFYERIGPGKYATHRETKVKYAIRKLSREDFVKSVVLKGVKNKKADC